MIATREQQRNTAVLTTDTAAEHTAPPLPNSVFSDIGAGDSPLAGTVQPEGLIHSDLQGEQ